MRMTVPDDPMCWTMAAFSMSQTKGLGIISQPLRHQSTRPFYVRVEMPDVVVRGEQIGIRIALFNYFHLDMEVRYNPTQRWTCSGIFTIQLISHFNCPTYVDSPTVVRISF